MVAQVELAMARVRVRSELWEVMGEKKIKNKSNTPDAKIFFI
jgi:hypothetical protein